MRDQLSRRGFIQKTVSVGALTIGTAALVSACGKKEGGGEAKAAAGCNDLTGLSDADKGMRTSNKYVDKAADAKKACDLCALYKAAAAGAACGGCSVIKGPIAPKGSCNLFAPKA
ncbi:MAG: hypothetical protein KC502_16155 [Myxococcales bacterium]|nr:hypothetical protein [Myxococcales bacterium]